MTQPNPIGLAIVLPFAIFSCGFVAGIYVAIRFYCKPSHKSYDRRAHIQAIPSGIERHWMENGDAF